MIRYWMEKGIRGFRLDAIDNIVKNGHGGNDQQSEKIHTYLQEMNKYSFGLQDNLPDSWGDRRNNAGDGESVFRP